MPNNKLYSDKEIKEWLKDDKLDQKTANKVAKLHQKRTNCPIKPSDQDNAPRRISAKFITI